MSSAPDTIDPTWAWQPFEPTAGHEWNRSLAAHLFRRAAFGATAAQIDAAVKQSPAAVVEQIVRGADDSSDVLPAERRIGDNRSVDGRSAAARRLVGVRHARHEESAARANDAVLARALCHERR